MGLHDAPIAGMRRCIAPLQCQAQQSQKILMHFIKKTYPLQRNPR